LNAAVEATALDDRAFGALLPQDAFLRDHISSDDVLVVSVGGNDVALAPTVCTAAHMGVLSRCTPLWCLGGDSNSEPFERRERASPIRLPFACVPNLYALPGGGARNCDCGRPCCGLPGCVAGVCGCPCGFGYAVDLFGNRVQNYVRRLVARTKPKKVLVCTIYYPREKRAARGTEDAAASWADPALRALGYDADPRSTRALIRAVHAHATSRITVPGVPVVPVPLFEVLDPRDARDYEQRVEPSAAGGRKMARAIAAAIGEF
jgi:lysophospholipase L1-like esterase